MVVPKEVIPKFKPRQTSLSAGHLNKVRSAAIRSVRAVPPLKVVQTADAWLVSHEPHFPNVFMGRIHSDAPDWSDNRYYVVPQRLMNSDAGASDQLDWSDALYPHSDPIVVENLAEISDSHILTEAQEIVVTRVRDMDVPPNWRYVTDSLPGPCMQSDQYSPWYSDWASDLGFIKPLPSDVSGDPTDSDHFLVKGWNYLSSDHKLNPWFIVDFYKRTGLHFAVRVTKTAGVTGDYDTQCSFTYRVTNLRSDVVLGTGMTPGKRRPSFGMMSDTAPSDFGTGFYTSDAFVLWDANESLVASDCS